jgi:hypothetical protein
MLHSMDVCVITIHRAGLFFSCRKYLLRSLYSDLQELSSASNENDDIPLDALPAPSTHETRNEVDKKALHSQISRTVFSACFSESSIMFLLLMLQGFNALNPRCAWPSEHIKT